MKLYFSIGMIVGAIILLFVLFLWIGFFNEDSGFETKMSSADIVNYLIKNKSTFEELKTMYEADGYPGYLWRDDVDVLTKKHITTRRIKKYQKLMKSKNLFRLNGDSLHFELTLITEGDITTGGCMKGYMYLKEKPKLLYDILPECYNNTKPNGEYIYMSIGHKWYAYVYYN